MSIASGGQKHIKITSSLFALAIATVLLRFLARRRAKLHLGIDDWTLLTALALVLCIYIEGLVCTGAPLNQEKSPQFTSFVGVLLGGIGKHVTELSPSELTILLKCYVIVWATFAATFAVTKVSILLLYIRIFPVRSLRVACAIVGTLVLVLGISIFIIGFCRCRPFSYSWDQSIPGGRCLPIYPVFYGSAVPTLLLNAAVVGLPLPILWHLQMTRVHKVALIATFSLGGLVCITGIIRILSIKTFDPADLSYTITNSAILVITEPCVAIISICLPTILPILRDISSYTTIEYKKAMCRINTALEDRRIRVQEFRVEASETIISTIIVGRQLKPAQETPDGITEVASEYEDGNENVFPTKPIVVGGQMMSV